MAKQQVAGVWSVDEERERFLRKITLLHSGYNFSVTSWWRSPTHNKKVGGHPKSLHLDGLAVDCVMDYVELSLNLLSNAKVLGLHGIIEADHVHIQSRSARKVKP